MSSLGEQTQPHQPTPFRRRPETVLFLHNHPNPRLLTRLHHVRELHFIAAVVEELVRDGLVVDPPLSGGGGGVLGYGGDLDVRVAFERRDIDERGLDFGN